MKINIQGLGGRLQRARKGTGLSQEAVATKIGVSWMTVHRWERSQRSISDENLDRLCDLYDRPFRWFLTLEDGDLAEETGPAGEASRTSQSAAANRLSHKISDAPESQRPMIEKVVENLLDALQSR
jgi:transcriptional regulator with XRE-family HTH domain